MNGVHDMGGMDGFGKVEPEPNEPSPPIATMTKAGMTALADIDGDTVHRGAASTPAIAASAQPRPNTAVRTRGRLMPSSSTISGSRLPARRIRP